MAMKEGTRIGTYRSSTEDSFYLFGFGVYVGNEIPPNNVKFLGSDVKKAQMKFQLDPQPGEKEGKVVWECECWYDTEENIKKTIAGRTVVVVDIEVARIEHSKKPEPVLISK